MNKEYVQLGNRIVINSDNGLITEDVYDLTDEILVTENQIDENHIKSNNLLKEIAELEVDNILRKNVLSPVFASIGASLISLFYSSFLLNEPFLKFIKNVIGGGLKIISISSEVTHRYLPSFYVLLSFMGIGAFFSIKRLIFKMTSKHKIDEMIKEFGNLKGKQHEFEEKLKELNNKKTKVTTYDNTYEKKVDIEAIMSLYREDNENTNEVGGKKLILTPNKNTRN